VIVNLSMHGECGTETSTKTDIVPVKVVFTDTNGCYDKTLTDTFISLWRQGQLIFDFPVSKYCYNGCLF
jgi:PKD repeat protein